METERLPRINVEYEGNLERSDLKCPYCDEFQSDSWEINFNDDRIEIECCECGKKFWGTEIVTRDFKSEADCELNKEEHKFEISGEGWLKCKVCGEIKLKELLSKLEDDEQSLKKGDDEVEK